VTVRELIKAIGSQAKIAKRLGVTETLPSHWIRRGYIPIRYWGPLLAMADEQGLDITLQTIYQSCIDGMREGATI